MTTTAFARTLRELRAASKFSQETLAEMAGLHRTYISQLERGLKSPSLDTVGRLGDALSVSLVDIAVLIEKYSNEK